MSPLTKAVLEGRDARSQSKAQQWADSDSDEEGDDKGSKGEWGCRGRGAWNSWNAMGEQARESGSPRQWGNSWGSPIGTGQQLKYLKRQWEAVGSLGMRGRWGHQVGGPVLQ